MPAVQETVDQVRQIDVDQYKYGFETLIASDKAPKGLSEDTVRFISAKKEEPAWMLEWRLDAYRRWLTMREPQWAKINYGPIDYQNAYYYSAPSNFKAPKSLDDIDPEILKTYDKLGIPLREREALLGIVREPSQDGEVGEDGEPAGAAQSRRGRCRVRQRLGRHHLQGRAEEVRRDLHADLRGAARASRPGEAVSRLGRAGVGQFLRDAQLGGVLRRLVRLRAAGRALPDGAVDLLPHQREEHRPVRAHADHRRQGLVCELPRRLHRADARREPAARRGGRADRARRCRDQVFDHPELVSGRRAAASGGVYNFVTKRGDCRGARSKISWTQLETGSAITWKYPSCILRGDGSRGEFYSIAISNGHQQVDSGTKMLHLGKNTTSRIISKGIAAGQSQNTYRGLVSAHRKAKGARNFTNCDSLLIGDQCGAHTVPYIEAKNSSAVFEHEATTSKISEDMLFYCRQRGLSAEEATALVVNGFVKDVLQQLPMEFAVEAQKLISVSLEGSVG